MALPTYTYRLDPDEQGLIDDEADERWYIVVVLDAGGRLSALSRREHEDGQPFAGGWRLLGPCEAERLASAFNDDPTEPRTSRASVVEVYRFEHDPVWTEEFA